jgi:hypothetical protein
VSNTSSSRVVARIQPSALIFTTLVLIIGALLLASNNIDPKASERARFTDTPAPTSSLAPTVTPVDVFAYSKFTSWQSPDGLLQFERPDGWDVQSQASAGTEYIVAAPAAQYEYIRIIMSRTDRLGIGNAAATVTPAKLIEMLFANLPTDQPAIPPVQPKQAAGLNGAGVHQSLVQTDQSGQRVPLDRELWILSLDPTHVLVIQAVSLTADWPKMQPIFDHLVQTLKVDAAGVVKALTALEATAAATGVATGAATQAGTAAARAVPTTVSTAQATRAAPATAPATATAP